MPAASSNTSTGGSRPGCSDAVSSSRLVTSCSLMGSPLSADIDPARNRRFPALDADVQDAFPVGGAHLVRIEIVGKRDHAVEPAGEALVQVHARAFVRRQIGLALARDAEHAALELHFDLA